MTTDTRPICTQDTPAPQPASGSDVRKGWRHPDVREIGECSFDCCTDFRCPHCGFQYRYEWPD